MRAFYVSMELGALSKERNDEVSPWQLKPLVNAKKY
jgi:hypothetical protein